jgi:hypothetical protein
MINRYAKIEDGIVTNIVLSDDNFINNLEGSYIKVTEQTRNAEIGFTYDDSKGYFISVSPWPSWVLDENDIWVSPVGPKPDGLYRWDEENTEWKKIVIVSEE